MDCQGPTSLDHSFGGDRTEEIAMGGTTGLHRSRRNERSHRRTPICTMIRELAREEAALLPV
jgi:hypothetical protein